MNEERSPTHMVAVIGGAVAGAQAVETLTSRGIGVVVIEQNVRPYGKIEDGLPRWHGGLRLTEYQRIDAALQHPLVHFLPQTKLGRDIPFADITRTWGVSAVILANGAWRDRPLGVPGVDDYIGRGFYYQNPFIYWFNHATEEDYSGPRCEIGDGGIVIGGGLASIDVVKVLMLETIASALRQRGVDADPVALEHTGCDKVLTERGLTLEKLGVQPATLFYRRRLVDMPLVEYKDGATDEEKRKTEKTRSVLIEKAMRRYLFRVETESRPIETIAQGNRLVGLRFVKTTSAGGRLVDVPGSEFDVHSPVTIASVGSVPEPISGIPMCGELYQWGDETIFGLGNVVTGKGNINASRRHSKVVAETVADVVTQRPTLSPADWHRLLGFIRARQQAVGFAGTYDAWIKKNPPIDFESRGI